MRSALRLHDKVLREAMRLHGGYEVKSENGAFMLAFGAAHDALEFVADAQRRLLCADWSQELLADRAASVVRGDANRLIFAGLREHGRPLRRRRVSHRSQHRAHGLFGPTANAARLAKAAHEGQILVSESLQAGAPTSEQWTLHDLGHHRLPGWSDPTTSSRSNRAGSGDAFRRRRRSTPRRPTSAPGATALSDATSSSNRSPSGSPRGGA